MAVLTHPDGTDGTLGRQSPSVRTGRLGTRDIVLTALASSLQYTRLPKVHTAHKLSTGTVARLEGVQLATISPSQKTSLFSQPSAWLLEIYDISGILNFMSMNFLLVRRCSLDISREQ